MKKNFLQYAWMTILLALLVGLTIWGIWFVEKIENKISIFGIVTVIVAAFTSVLTVSINNKKAKERDYELHVLKEKQKVYDHFYNSFFELLKGVKLKQKGVSEKAANETMLFKQGLMNWGSERLINKFIEYDNKLSQGGDNFDLLKDGNNFLKEIRRDMGFNDSKELNLINILLDAQGRKDVASNTK